MAFRRLFCLMLALALLLPCTAFASPGLMDITVYYQSGTDETGQPIVVSAVRGVDYDWAYTDQTQTRIWIQVLPGSLVPLNYVRITALIDDGMGGVSEYTYFDVMTGQEWLNLETSETTPLALQLRSADGATIQGDTLTLSYNAYTPGGTVDPTPPAVETPAIEYEQLPAYEDPRGRVTGQNAALYSAPNGDYVASVSADALVTFQQGMEFSTQHDAQGGLWCLVALEDGTQGYLKMSEFRFLTADEAYQLDHPQQSWEEPETPYAVVGGNGAMGYDAYGQPAYDANGQPVTLLPDARVYYTGNRFYDANNRILMEVVLLPEGTQSAYIYLDDVSYFMNTQQATEYQESLKEQMPEHETDFLRPNGGAPLRSADGSESGSYFSGEEVLRLTGESFHIGNTLVLGVSVYPDGASGYVTLSDISHFMTQQEVTQWEEAQKEQMPEHETDFLRPNGGAPLRSADGSESGSYFSGEEVLRLTGESFHIGNTLVLGVSVYPDGASGYVTLSDISHFMTQQEVTQWEEAQKEQMPEHETDFLRPNGGAPLRSADGSESGSYFSGEEVLRLTGESFHIGNTLVLGVSVYPDGASGYVTLSDISHFMTQQEVTQWEEAQKEQMPEHENEYARTGQNGAPIYNANGQLTGQTLEAGVTLCYTGESLYSGNTLLVRMLVQPENQVSYYLPVGSLQFLTNAERDEYLESLLPDPTQPPTQPPTEAPTASPTEAPPTSPTEPPKQEMPAVSNTYGYAEINAGGATLYNANLTQAGTLSAHAVVQYQPNANKLYDPNGRLLVYVTQQNGASGYVMVDNMTFLSQAEAEEIANPQEDPVPQATGHAYVLGNNVSMRRSPSATSAATGTVNANNVVKLDGSERDGNGNIWHYATYTSGATTLSGWIASSSLQIMTAEQEEAYLREQQATQPPQPTQTATAQPTSSPTTQPVRGYMVVTNTQFAPLLLWNDVGAPVKSYLNNGDVVYVDTQITQNGISFNHVVTDKTGEWGYILADYLRAMTQQELNEYFQQSTPQTPSPSAPNYNTGDFSGYALLTSNNVNFRKSPSMSGGRHSQLKQGTLVRVLNEVSAEGYTWYQCESGGVIGYLRGDMLSLLTIREYQLVRTNSSYTQSGSIITPTSTANTSGISSSIWATARPNATSGITFVTLPPMSSASPSPSPSASPSASAQASSSPSPSASPSGGVGGFVTISPSDPDASFGPTTAPTGFPVEETSGPSLTGLWVALGLLLVLGAGGMYGYSVYNKSRRQQAEQRAKRLSEQAQRTGQSGERPAVRRPAPPVTPPGAAAQQQRRDSRQPNPYARPQTPARDGASGMPRASVDGKPLGAQNAAPGASTPSARPQDPNNPYLRQMQSARPGTAPQPPAAPKASETADTAKPKETTDTSAYQRPRMPVAPPPVQPDNAPAEPRRRRRTDRYHDADAKRDK